jgi:hypothetical protein
MQLKRTNSMSMCRMITVFVIFIITYTMSIVDVHDIPKGNQMIVMYQSEILQ